MRKKTDILENAHGLLIEVESVYVERCDSGREVNDWVFDEYTVAKILVYRDLDTMLNPAEEQRRIAQVFSIGTMSYLSAIARDEGGYDPGFVADAIRKLEGGSHD